ncbi:cache domain-containing sensor histidine kinase [Paenibacillus soyae]|uniref:Histidine kinase n=1 Tax=Paenibacillus soyae TaxID=2969249 RepID=A0A9X2MV21_9BACL|nr:sensor histidine kinase [Paenibacillus soyae]MCR2807090.1 histidine kinase [Paenibacillus soyae]
MTLTPSGIKGIRFPIQASLQTKLLLTFLILLVIVLGCFLAYVNWVVIKPLKVDNENKMLVTVSTASNQLDEYMKSQIQLSHRILSNQQIFNILANAQPWHTAEGLRQSRALKDMMFEAIGPTMNIRDMIIFDLEGQSIASFIGHDDSPAQLDSRMKALLDDGQTGGLGYIVAPHPSSGMSFTRVISNQNGHIFGYLSIMLDPSYLRMPAEDIAVGDLYIVNAANQVVVSSTPVTANNDMPELRAGEQPDGLYTNDSGDYIAYHQSTVTGWTTYLLTPRQAVIGPVNSVKYLSILLITSLMVFSFIYIYFSSRSFLLPIRKLRGQISRIQYSNLNVRVDSKAHNDELVALGDSFQELLVRLQQSIEREKLALHEEVKARGSALQAQIAPHFIHNSLYLISIASQEGKNEAVSAMCKHLSDSLRYIVSSPYQHVSLAEELEHTRNYLSLVQQNYEDDLEWTIDADESAEFIQLPRLVIQPFVENCIEHGFVDTDPPWRIAIRVKLYNGIWAIEISDNGDGIDEARLGEIMANITGSEDRDHELHIHASGLGNMGVVNTVNRLKLMYKNRLFFNLYNNAGEERGVTVQIIGSLTRDFY